MKTLNAVSLLALVSTFTVLPFAGAAQGGGGGGNSGGGGGPSRGGGAGAGGIGGGNGASNRPAVPDRPADRIAPAERPDKADRSASQPAQQLAHSMQEINQTAFAQRRQLLDSVDMKLESSRDALKKIQTDAKVSRADARAEFKTALDAVKARETELGSAAKAARNANEAGWETNRSALAKAHQAHLDALARLDSVVRPPKI
ncbi:MAG: hypothetical protein ABIZ81_15830 [Opitutaceae bacterium]